MRMSDDYLLTYLLTYLRVDKELQFKNWSDIRFNV